MDLVQKFTDYLNNQPKKFSSVTIKNYKHDILHFIAWFESQFQPFSPLLVTPQIISLYEKSNVLSRRSIDRHLSSLRKFFNFLRAEGLNASSPFESSELNANNYTPATDPWHLKPFKDHLYIYNKSDLTIKNYLMDVRHFISWAQEVTGIEKAWSVKEKNLFTKIDEALIKEYKNRLLKNGASKASVNRKLSSLRQYFRFALDENLIIESVESKSQSFENLSSSTSHFTPQDIPSQYSRFPPLRLMQRTLDGANFLIDQLLVLPLAYAVGKIQYFIWHISGKPLFYTIRRARPRRYSRFILISVIAGITGLIIYGALLKLGEPEPSVLGQIDQISLRTLPFQGRLTDSQNNPITATTNVRFAIYNSPTASSSALLWQEVQKVNPKADGSFLTDLGSVEAIPHLIFMENPSLYLGITIENKPELVPRQAIPTVAYASNADTLQGFPLITQPNVGTKNVVLALDSGGNLAISGEVSSTFQTTEGDFKLSGQTLILATNPGSNGNVQISPDGSGKIDLQKPLQNTTNNNSIPTATGAVEIDDLLAILASSSGQSAFTINQNDTGPIISASASGTAKFTLDSDGTTYFAGNVGIGEKNPITKMQVAGSITPASADIYDLGSPTLHWNTLYVNSIIASPSATFGYWQRTKSSITPANVSDAINLGATESSSATIHLAGVSGENSFIRTGNLGIGTDSPNATLHVRGSFLLTDTNGIARFGILDNGNVGIGTTSPQAALDVMGGGRFNCSSDFTNSSGVTSCSDVAEVYDTDENLEKGDVIKIVGSNKVGKTIQPYDGIIGVYSTSPGLLIGNNNGTSIGSDIDTSLPIGKVPVALTGRASVKATTENGPIEIGDSLASSSIPGYAMKATQTGPVLGKAMEPLRCDNSICQGKIMAFINVSWYDAQIYVTESGDLSIILPINTNTTNTANEKFGIGNWKLEIGNSGEAIRRIGAFSDGVIANLRTGYVHAQAMTVAGLVDAQQIVSKTLSATSATFEDITTQTLISPIAQVDRLRTNVISPLDSDSLIIQLASNSATATLEIRNATGVSVATIDSYGSATFSGSLKSQQLITNDASVSGTLRAQKIIAEEIDGIIAQSITNVTNIYEAESTLNSQLSTLNSTDLASYSAQLASVENLDAAFGKFSQGLIALGPTSLFDAAIAGQLSIGASLILSDNSINVLGADLNLQPLRLGGISFLSGLVSIDSNGNLKTEGDLTVKGRLNTSIISPLPDQDLVIQNSSGSAVLSVSQLGDLVASGSATIQKLNLSLVKEVLALSDSEIIASGSAGVATISAQRSALTINTPFVTEKSLIYITPREETNNQVLFLMRQIPYTSFTVGLEEPSKKDIQFNWLLVN